MGLFFSFAAFVQNIFLLIEMRKSGCASRDFYKNVVSFAWHSQLPRVTPSLRLRFVCTKQHRTQTSKAMFAFYSLYVRKSQSAQRSAPRSAALVNGGLL